jgi:hypothetical protein
MEPAPEHSRRRGDLPHIRRSPTPSLCIAHTSKNYNQWPLPDCKRTTDNRRRAPSRGPACRVYRHQRPPWRKLLSASAILPGRAVRAAS